MPTDKCTAETLFDLASTTKTNTAAAVALLVDDDDKYPNVKWTTSVSQLLPDDFMLPDRQLTRDVTIEDILSHRTGIPTHDETILSVRAKTPDNAKSVTRNLRHLTFVKPLRTSYIYSNLMFTATTHLVEKVSGMPYTDFLRTRLWEPLGMTNTFHDLPDIEAHDAMSRKATGYRWDKKKGEYIAIPAYPQPEGQGAGCIFSSAGDYAKWIRALIQRAPLLSEATHKQLITPRTICSPEEKNDIPFSSPALYCLGLVYETYRGRTLISHDGNVPGFKAKVAYLPDFEQGLVIFANADSAMPALQILAYRWIDDVLGVPEAERTNWADFFRKEYEREEAEDEALDRDLEKPGKPEPLGIALEKIMGTYHDAGYKDLVLEMRDGKVMADCQDRCFPFMLTFEHLTGDKFVVDNHDLWTDTTRKIKGEVRIEGGKAVALGVGLEEDVEGGLIWFDRENL
jgi:CubicO group peptidase (beta-lactamase class C family)